MTSRQLLRLYPTAWRERYGEEFLEVAGEGTLGLQQAIDMVSGAIDARLSRDVRRAVRPAPAATGGMMLKVMTGGCHANSLRMSRQDAVIAALLMIGLALVGAVAGFWLRSRGYGDAAEGMMAMLLPFSLAATLPWTFMKGQPWRAQVVIVGGTLVLTALIGWASVQL